MTLTLLLQLMPWLTGLLGAGHLVSMQMLMSKAENALGPTTSWLKSKLGAFWWVLPSAVVAGLIYGLLSFLASFAWIGFVGLSVYFVYKMIGNFSALSSLKSAVETVVKDVTTIVSPTPVGPVVTNSDPVPPTSPPVA